MGPLPGVASRLPARQPALLMIPHPPGPSDGGGGPPASPDAGACGDSGGPTDVHTGVGVHGGESASQGSSRDGWRHFCFHTGQG